MSHNGDRNNINRLTFIHIYTKLTFFFFCSQHKKPWSEQEWCHPCSYLPSHLSLHAYPNIPCDWFYRYVRCFPINNGIIQTSGSLQSHHTSSRPAVRFVDTKPEVFKSDPRERVLVENCWVIQEKLILAVRFMEVVHFLVEVAEHMKPKIRRRWSKILSM